MAEVAPTEKYVYAIKGLPKGDSGPKYQGERSFRPISSKSDNTYAQIWPNSPIDNEYNKTFSEKFLDDESHWGDTRPRGKSRPRGRYSAGDPNPRGTTGGRGKSLLRGSDRVRESSARYSDGANFTPLGNRARFAPYPHSKPVPALLPSLLDLKIEKPEVIRVDPPLQPSYPEATASPQPIAPHNPARGFRYQYEKQSIVVQTKKLKVNLPIPDSYPELGNLLADVVKAAQNVEFGWTSCDEKPFDRDQKDLYGSGSAMDTKALEAIIKLLAASIVVQRTVDGTPAFEQACEKFMDNVKNLEHLESKLLERNVYLSLHPKHGAPLAWPDELFFSLHTVFQVYHQYRLEPPAWTTKVDKVFMDPSVGARLRRQYQTAGRDDGDGPFQGFPATGDW